jgi:hypothetical protein
MLKLCNTKGEVKKSILICNLIITSSYPELINYFNEHVMRMTTSAKDFANDVIDDDETNIAFFGVYFLCPFLNINNIE